MVERTIRAELEEQRCLIEQQQVEVQRQRHQIQLLRQLTVAMQNELDNLRADVHASLPRTSRKSRNGHERLTASPAREMMPSGNQR